MEITRRSLLKAGLAIGVVTVGSPLRNAFAVSDAAGTSAVELRIAALGTGRAPAEPRLDLLDGNFKEEDLYELLNVDALKGTGVPAVAPYETAIAVSGLAGEGLKAATAATDASQSVLIGGVLDPMSVAVCVLPTKAFYPYSLDLVTTVVEFPAADGTLLEEAFSVLPDSPKASIEFALADPTLTKIVSSEVVVLTLP
jgi:hypothetical protein